MTWPIECSRQTGLEDDWAHLAPRMACTSVISGVSRKLNCTGTIVQSFQDLFVLPGSLRPRVKLCGCVCPFRGFTLLKSRPQILLLCECHFKVRQSTQFYDIAARFYVLTLTNKNVSFVLDPTQHSSKLFFLYNCNYIGIKTSTRKSLE